jgi:DNA (cytosine-5)-methyltransferase 1
VSTKINQLDLFSGIGGFHLGFERAGYEVTSYFSEIDKHAVAVYQHKFKDATYVGSVTDVRGADLPNIDLITFGSPCQDFSLAGKRKGMDGERSSLILEAIRLITECQPRAFVWENVKGTFSSNDGEDFAAILQAFSNIGGYRLEWQLLNTSWFLPQNRERIYLVGYSTTPRGDWGGVFPIGEGAELSDQKKRNKSQREASSKAEDSIARALPAHVGYGSEDTFVEVNPLKIKVANKKGYQEAEDGDAIRLYQPNSETQRGRVGKGVAHTLETTGQQGVVQPKIIGYTRDAKGKVTDRHLKDEAGTIHSSSGSGGNTDQYVIDYRIRRLTPIECERLQGFPDNHTEYGIYDGEVKKMSNTQRYKQCGNAVTVDVVKAVAQQLIPIYNANR